MASAGTVTVDFAARTAKFTAELKQVNSRLKSIEGGFQSLARVARVALSAFSVVAITGFVRSAAQAADQLGKTADKVGVSTQSLRAFQIAAEEAGVSTEQAVKLLTESQKRLGEASVGTGEAAKFIKLLRLDIKELQQLSPDRLFTTFADAINRLGATSERFAAAQALFGRSALEAFSLIQAGAPAIADAARFVERFGLALDRVSIKQIEAANDSLGRLRIVADAAGQRIAAGLAPFIEELSRRLLDATGSTEGLQARVEQFGSVVLVAFEIAGNAVRSLQAAFFGLAAAAGRVLQALTFGAVSEAFAASVNENLRKANEALAQIKSIEQIQQSIVATLEAARQRASEAVAAQQQAAIGATGTLAEPGTGAVDAEIEALQRRLEFRKFLEADLTRNIQEEQRKRLDIIVESEEERFAAIFDVENRILELRRGAAAAGLDFLQLLAARSKTAAKAVFLFEKGKALADTIIATQVAAAKALQIYGPTPQGFAAASAAIAFGVARAAIITATAIEGVRQISAGASLGTPANPIFTQPTGGVEPLQPGATGQSAVTVVIQGHVFSSRETADWIIDQIKEAVNDRDVVIISADSRQALDLGVGG